MQLLKLYVLIEIFQGCLNEVHGFTDLEKARKARDQAVKDMNMTDAAIHKRQPECRTDDENEIHLHEIDVELLPNDETTRVAIIDAYGHGSVYEIKEEYETASDVKAKGRHLIDFEDNISEEE